MKNNSFSPLRILPKKKILVLKTMKLIVVTVRYLRSHLMRVTARKKKLLNKMNVQNKKADMILIPRCFLVFSHCEIKEQLSQIPIFLERSWKSLVFI